MASSSDAERRDLRLFLKFFTIRAVETIVQSRQGRAVRTRSRVLPATTDWFNLAIEDSGTIAADLKAQLGNRFPPDLPALAIHICLQTADGPTLHLEVWQISFDRNHTDALVDLKAEFYHRLGTALRSVLAVSRATPAYRLYSRTQGADTFLLCYQVVEGQSDCAVLLGPEAKLVRLGDISCPFGTVGLTLSYRTKMEIPAGPASPSVAAARQESHFGPQQPMSLVKRPSVPQMFPFRSAEDLSMDPSTPSRVDFLVGTPPSPYIGAAVDPSPPVCHLSVLGVATTRPYQPRRRFLSETPTFQSPSVVTQRRESVALPLEIPFAKLLSVSQSTPTLSAVANPPPLPTSATPVGSLPLVAEKPDDDEDNSADSSDSDGFVHVVDTPILFPSTDYASGLGQFVKEFRAAPSLLRSLEDPPAGEEIPVGRRPLSLPTSDDIDDFQRRQEDYDRFVRALQQQNDSDAEED